MPWCRFTATEIVEQVEGEGFPVVFEEYDYFTADPDADALDEMLNSLFDFDTIRRGWKFVDAKDVPEEAVQKVIEHRRKLVRVSMDILMELGADKE